MTLENYENLYTQVCQYKILNKCHVNEYIATRGNQDDLILEESHTKTM